MEKVYITKANFKSIANDLSYVVLKNEVEDIYRLNLSTILAIPELNVLSALKIIISSTDNYTAVINLKENHRLKTQRDKKSRFIYLGGTPAYHKKNDCIYLASEYKNYKIPVQIPDDKIEEYRAFFIKNIDLFERNQAAFYANVELKFSVRIEDVKEIQASNTGGVGVENSIMKSEAMLLNDIAMHVKEMIDFKKSNENTWRTISKFGFNTPKAIKNATSHNLNGDNLAIVKEWHELKNKLKDLIMSHLIARYNPEFSFNGGMLDALGFKKCRSCYS